MGTELDKAVAKAMGLVPCDKWRDINLGSAGGFCKTLYADSCEHESGKCYPIDVCPKYSTEWSAGGPLIEKYGIEISIGNSETKIWRARIVDYDRGITVHANQAGETPLIAAMKAIVASGN